MVYYFIDSKRIEKANLVTYSKSTQLKHLKEISFTHLEAVSNKISQELGLILKPYWISQMTFGAVLCDFEPEKSGPSIIGSHKAFFDLIKNDIDYVILSRNIDRNIKTLENRNGRFLIINIIRYKKFGNTLSDKFRRTKLFLFKNLSKEEEDIVNNWIESKPSEIKKLQRLQKI